MGLGAIFTLLVFVVVVIQGIRAARKLSASGREPDVQKATLYAVQAVAGFLSAFFIAGIGLAVAQIIR